MNSEILLIYTPNVDTKISYFLFTKKRLSFPFNVSSKFFLTSLVVSVAISFDGCILEIIPIFTSSSITLSIVAKSILYVQDDLRLASLC